MEKGEINEDGKQDNEMYRRRKLDNENRTQER
jgi:hypothetical protein